jgi:putative membrane protein insertion efficiency factor
MIKKIFTAPIRFYQKYVSPSLGANCRFYPSCSQYAIEAIEEWGVIIGIFLGVWRILRCNPLCKCGYDPVPRNKRKKD